MLARPASSCSAAFPAMQTPPWPTITAGKLVFDPDIHCTHDHDEASCGSHCGGGVTDSISKAARTLTPQTNQKLLHPTTTWHWFSDRTPKSSLGGYYYDKLHTCRYNMDAIG